MSPQTRSRRIDGSAIFAATAFAAGLATIIALDRVGAPAGLVQAGGSILALFGLVVFGLGSRNADLASFMAAGRGLAPIYGALGTTAVAAGLALCLRPDLTPSDPPVLGLAIGLALGTLVYAPLLRRFGATSLADVVATRFSRSPVRFASAFAIWIGAALTALGGYRVGVTAAQALFGQSRLWAEIVVAAVLALTVTPGGLVGVASCASAGGGALAMIAVVAFLSGWRVGPLPFNPDGLFASANVASAPPQLLSPLVATMLAAAGFFAFAPAAVASRNVQSTIVSGLASVALCLVLAGLMGASTSAVDPGLGQNPSSPVAASLFGAAALAASLALAVLGIHVASRAFGVALADPPQPFPKLASVRLARMRAVQLVVVIGCVICDGRDLLDARTAVVVAMALLLAFTTPLVGLAAIGRVGPAAASVGLLAALAVAVACAASATEMPGAAELLQDALFAAAAGFLAGSLACLPFPRRGPPPTPGAFDPFRSG